jgi:hypothetical protein
MTDTTFSIELKGLNLPEEMKDTLQAQLRSVVLAEIAKTDLGKEVSVQSLPHSSERALAQRDTILGLVVRHLGESNARSVNPSALGTSGASTLHTPRYTAAELAAMLRVKTRESQAPAADATAVFDAPLLEVIESVYYRPDIRAAVASQGRAFAEMLARDPEAVQVLDEITDGALSSDAQAERFGPVAGVAIMVAATFVAGAATGYLANRHK